MKKLIQLAGMSLVSLTLATQAFALNPQPEPPGKDRVDHGTVSTIGNAGSQVMLNPQPLPPRVLQGMR